MTSKIQVSEELRHQIGKVQADGFKIYSMIMKTKRALKNPTLHFPDEVILKVCDEYWFHKKEIRNPYAWFLRVLKAEWEQWNARGNMAEHAQYKRDSNPRGGCAMIGDILAKMGASRE